MSSPSEVRRVTGGPWAKGHRFYDPNTAKAAETPGPGAPYQLPSLFSEHAQGPVYKQEFESPKHTQDNGMPHPSKDRTAWMIGTTKNDLAYYSNIAGNMGPAFYTPSLAPTPGSSPRTHVFAKNRRFMSLTHRYISKEHNQANLCTASPGPKYAPKQCHLDLTAREPPEYSFGGRNLPDRSSFIHGSIKNGALYSARPATSDLHTNVGPAQYAVRAGLTEPTSPRPVWSKADRFATQDKLFISKRHVRSKLGLNSPGPKYAPTNYDIATNLKQQGKPANVPSGKWCP